MASSLRSLAEAKNTPENLEKALGCLVDLVRARRSQSKPPPPANVLDSLRFLFQSHLDAERRFTRNEVYLASEAFKHLDEISPDLSPEDSARITTKDLRFALTSLANSRDQERFRSDTSAFARLLFQQLRERDNGEGLGPDNITWRTRTYIDILSSTGSAIEARDFLLESSQANEQRDMGLWIPVIKGLFGEGLGKEATELLQEMETRLGPLTRAHHDNLVIFLASHDNLDAVKGLYRPEMENGKRPSLRALKILADSCIRNRETKWGRHVFEALLTAEPRQEVLDTVMLWLLVERQHKEGIDSILKEALSLLQLGKEQVTMEDFNRLIEYTFSQGDAETARRCLDSAVANGLKPNSSTYILQLDQQVRNADLNAATASYNMFLSEEPPSDDRHIPVLNRYLTALCNSKPVNIEAIMRVVDGLLDQGADLHAETLAGLCRIFLEKDDLAETTGLLRYRVDSFPAVDRARISAVFQQFITDPEVTDHRAFNAYELFRRAFPETPVEARIPIMQSFFNRNRSDLACLVFGHMRQREDIEGRPTALAYAKCFEGIAQCSDVDGLQMVYNMLKLDLFVEQTTRVHNALMAAYAACHMPFTSIIDHFWKIMDSREGPTQSTFALALRACETWVPQGGLEARNIMALMQSYGAEITREIYHCYIGALAGQSEFEYTIELIEEMENDTGMLPDAVTIGTFYNAIPWQYRKDEVEAWAKQAFPHLWEELLTFGDEIDEEWEVRYFKIDRKINMDDDLLWGGGEYNPMIAKRSQMFLEAPPK